MPFCRIFQKPDGSVAVMHPNRRLQEENESDVDFCKRICDADALKDDTLKGLPFVDVDRDKLPPRTRVNDKGDVETLRHAWKVSGDKIMVDEAVVAAPVALKVGG